MRVLTARLFDTIVERDASSILHVVSSKCPVRCFILSLPGQYCVFR